MKRGSLFLLLGALFFAAFSCSSPKEKEEALVLKISPTSAKTEASSAHDVKFTVTHNKDIKYALKSGKWASVIKEEAGSAKQTTVLTVHLEANSGEEQRSDVLEVTSGSVTLSVDIVQQPLGQVLSATELTLDGVSPQTFSVDKIKQAWTAEVVDENGASDWLEVTPASGSGMMVVTVNVRATGLNVASEARSARIRVKIGEAEVFVAVTQPSDWIAGNFQQKNYGLYNYDGAGAEIQYDKYLHQFSTTVGTGVRAFRILDPTNAKFLEISGLPSTYTPGSRYPVTVLQNLTSKLGSTLEKELTVFKEEDGYVWLQTDDKIGFVIKKVE